MNIPDENIDDVVRDEAVVHEAFEAQKITPEELSSIETVEQLQAQSQTLQAGEALEEVSDVVMPSSEDHGKIEEIIIPSQVTSKEQVSATTDVPESLQEIKENSEVSNEVKPHNSEIKNR
ncbi:MAG: hypothetical protein WC045_03755 [Patescibacteria group bacterium]